MNKKYILQGVAVAVIALGFGFLGGKLGQAQGASGHPLTAASNTTQKSDFPVIQSQQVQAPEIDGQTYYGLNQVDPKWVNKFLATQVHNSNGQSVSIPTNKPILVVAPWCQYCHQFVKFLGTNGLIDKVQVVGTAFNFNEETKKNSLNVKSVAQAEDLMQKALTQEKVSLSSDKMLYALPADGMDTQLPAFPLLLVPHDGKWYMQKGYYPSQTQWQNVLS